MGNGYSRTPSFELSPWPERSAKQLALLVLASYLLLGSLWILISDRLVFLLVDDAAISHQIQTLKGLFYVLSTGAMLYLLVHWGTKAIVAALIILFAPPGSAVFDDVIRPTSWTD